MAADGVPAVPVSIADKVVLDLSRIADSINGDGEVQDVSLTLQALLDVDTLLFESHHLRTMLLILFREKPNYVLENGWSHVFICKFYEKFADKMTEEEAMKFIDNFGEEFLQIYSKAFQFAVAHAARKAKKQ